MITHDEKKTVHFSRLKFRSITHQVEKSHRQVNYLNKFSQNNWFSRHTLKISGKFLNFFDEPGDRGRLFSSILRETREKRSSCRLLTVSSSFLGDASTPQLPLLLGGSVPAKATPSCTFFSLAR